MRLVFLPSQAAESLKITGYEIPDSALFENFKKCSQFIKLKDALSISSYRLLIGS
jgi:hypothetical protein